MNRYTLPALFLGLFAGVYPRAALIVLGVATCTFLCAVAFVAWCMASEPTMSENENQNCLRDKAQAMRRDIQK